MVVLADTHLRGGLERLPGSVGRAIEGADVVLHAGDITSPDALAALRTLAETHAVLGNNDVALSGLLPEFLVVDLAGMSVALVHDAGPGNGRAGRLKRRFPDADLVVFGHSHAPVDELGLGGQRLFNPGSPTQRRRQPYPTFGSLEIASGRVLAHAIEAATP